LIFELEEQLCFHPFHQKVGNVELTRDGDVFIQACAAFLEQRDYGENLTPTDRPSDHLLRILLVDEMRATSGPVRLPMNDNNQSRLWVLEMRQVWNERVQWVSSDPGL
jgi:hypothetical protein